MFSTIQQTIDVLKKGGVIMYPTDTVYGFGCSILEPRAIQRIRTIKGKKGETPMSIVCATLTQVLEYVDVQEEELIDIRKVLPGPYTFLLRAKDLTPRAVVSDKGLVGIRVPASKIACQLVEHLGVPIISTSVNRTGFPPLSDPHDIEEEFGDEVDAMIDGGVLDGPASTILETTERGWKLVRQGGGLVEMFHVIQ